MLLGRKVEMELNEVAGGRHLAQVQWFRTWESIRLTSNLEQWVPGPAPDTPHLSVRDAAPAVILRHSQARPWCSEL